MKFKINNVVYEVENSNNLFQINNLPIDIAIESFNNDYLILKQGNSRRKVWFSKIQNRIELFIDGHQLTLEVKEDTYNDVLDEEEDSSKQIIYSPMPGTIVKLEVNVGSQVKIGDLLMIIEAMKMETSLFAKIDGVIKEVNVVLGEKVNNDKALIVVEKS